MSAPKRLLRTQAPTQPSPGTKSAASAAATEVTVPSAATKSASVSAMALKAVLPAGAQYHWVR